MARTELSNQTEARSAGPLLPFFVALVFAWNLAWCEPSSAQPPKAPVEARSLFLLTGEKLPLKSLTITKENVAGEGLPEGLLLDDLRRIELAGSGPVANKPTVLVQTLGGGRIAGNSVVVEGDECIVDGTIAGKLSIPLDQIRAVRLEPQTANPEFDKAVSTPSAETDKFFIKVDEGKVDSTTGVLKALGAQDFEFEQEGEARKLPRAKLFGFIVAQPSADDDMTKALVTLRDGSTLGGEVAGLAEGKLTLMLIGGSQLEIPESAVASIAVRSSRMAFVSDLKPVEEEQRSIAFLDVPWQRDRSVLGKIMTLGSRTFDKGIGCHAECRLTYETGGKYDVLAAVIGIDAETLGKGDCVFTVLGDGESLFTTRVKGSDPPREIQVDLARVKRVTLVVEAGVGLDLGDHADWCDVRFIKNSKK